MLQILHDYGVLFLVGTFPNGPLGGLAGTLLLATLAAALALPLSILLAVARIDKRRVYSAPASAVVMLMRGTPLLMIIFWSNYALPLLLGGSVGPFWVMLGALVVYQSAYLAEVVRAGINALPRGQYEAARALGLSHKETLVRIILPQALYNSFPALLAQFVSIIKETSLGFVIGVHEFSTAAADANNDLLVKPVEIFSLLAITYFVVCFIFASMARSLERHMGMAKGVAPA
jgi:polar amino acid transport system permease protein